jgi:hypothetical protein
MDLLDEGDPGDQARAGITEFGAVLIFVDGPVDLAEADDHRLLGLGNDRDGASDQDQEQDRREGESDRVAGDSADHRAGASWRRCSSGSAR